MDEELSIKDFLIKHEMKIHQLSMARNGQKVPDWVLKSDKCREFGQDLIKLLYSEEKKDNG